MKGNKSFGVSAETRSSSRQECGCDSVLFFVGRFGTPAR